MRSWKSALWWAMTPIAILTATGCAALRPAPTPVINIAPSTFCQLYRYSPPPDFDSAAAYTAFKEAVTVHWSDTAFRNLTANQAVYEHLCR